MPFKPPLQEKIDRLEKKSKVGNRSWRPEYNSYYTGLLHFTLDTYLILLTVKQGGVKYHF